MTKPDQPVPRQKKTASSTLAQISESTIIGIGPARVDDVTTVKNAIIPKHNLALQPDQYRQAGASDNSANAAQDIDSKGINSQSEAETPANMNARVTGNRTGSDIGQTNSKILAFGEMDLDRNHYHWRQHNGSNQQQKSRNVSAER